MMKELPKIYEPKSVESKIYKMWLDGGYFHAKVDLRKEPFTIVIPPPNVTGQLHLGHAFDETLQDILIRYKRMQGYEALWVPGTDHAGIATQIKVEEALRTQEGKTRHDLGREAFLAKVWEWKEKYGGKIVQQLKKLGCSCDWERERFTMDDGCCKAVREVFVRLYEKGLIYKGTRIINWCPKCATALSDAEVEYNERHSHLWHIQYPLTDGTGYLTVATTRPETMLGDTAVAVHPKDERYSHLAGKTLLLPLMNREIPIVFDEYVDPAFGTGCVKITPCHDPNDFDVAERHKLEHILILDEKACVNANGGIYQGLSREQAKAAVLRDLESGGFLIKTEEHIHNAGSCYRCSTLVEPISSAQWFVKMKPLAEPAIDVVESGKLSFVPERFSKIYMNWMENVRDWCISRQLWWGHRIPAWTCPQCGHITVSRTDPEVCEKCTFEGIIQESDVLDTWFSSALWPFSTLGWPDKTEDLAYFYPTNVLVTGYDIIFFWVARMIFSGLEYTGASPFETVLIHGIVRDANGKKMSKSAGNGVDPLEIIDKYGADALRFYICTGNSMGNDIRFYMERCEAMRNFCNKLWNASRFVLMNLHNSTWELPEKLELSDMWVLSKYNALIWEVTENMDSYELGLAAQKIYDFVWDIYCDWYIELTKPRLQSGGDSQQAAEQILAYVLDGILKLLHPFMPFITEEIWQCLPHDEGDSLMVQSFPIPSSRLTFDEEAQDMDIIIDIIRAIRARRAEMNVAPSRKAMLFIGTSKTELISGGRDYILRLAKASGIEFSVPEDASGYVQCVTDHANIYMPLGDLADLKAERARLDKELAAAKKDFLVLESKLANPSFLTKAPEQIVLAERERAEKLSKLIINLENSIKSVT